MVLWGPFGWLYERCTNGASAPGSECFIQALPSVGDHKTADYRVVWDYFETQEGNKP